MSMLSALDCRWRLESGDNIFVHEAQRISEIGRVLKIWTDQVPRLRVIVTGSSAFEFAGKIGEPPTGQKIDLIEERNGLVHTYKFKWGIRLLCG